MQHSLSSPIKLVIFSLLILYFIPLSTSHFALFSFLSAGTPDTLWTSTYGGADMEISYSVQQTSDEGFIIVGSTGSLSTGYKVYLVRTNHNGDTLWTKTHGEIGGHSVQQTSDNGFIIAGNTLPSGSGLSDVYLIRTNSNGDTLWTNSFGGDTSDQGYSVQQTSDGGFIIAGYTKSYGVGTSDAYLIRTNSSGDSLWTKTYGGDDWDDAHSIQHTNDGGFIIAGKTASFGAGGLDAYLIRTNSNGDTIWTKTYGTIRDEWGSSVLQTNDSGFIIAGSSLSFGDVGWDVYLIRTDSNGDTLWTRTYGGTEWDFGSSVQQTNDSGFIIVGETSSYGAGETDVYLIRTNSDGDTLWTKTYGGEDRDNARSIQHTNDGGFIIAGDTESFGEGSFDVYLIRLAKETIGIQDDNLFNLINSNNFIIFYNHGNNLISIRYTIPFSSPVKLVAFDIQGKLVKVITDKFMYEGSYSVNWDSKRFGSGVYFLTLTVNGSSVSRRVVVVR